MRKQLRTYGVFLCGAFVLAPVKQETLQRSISLKEKQQQCVKKIEIEKGNTTRKTYNLRESTLHRQLKNSSGHDRISGILINLVFEHPIVEHFGVKSQ